MIDILELTRVFKDRYAQAPRIFQAPGRVNLIGEHTDYNNGFVLPMAIDRGTAVAIAARPDRVLRVWSLNIDDSVELDLERLTGGRHGTWLDYVEGIAAAIIKRGVALTGANIALKSDVSIGGGLSSSAALEVSLGMALAAISGCPIDLLTLALAGQTAEHVHVGLNSGIMDQFTSVFAAKNHAILLDCRSLEAKRIPIHLHEYQVVICDSRVRHALAGSEYNKRRRDCELGVKQLSTVLSGVKSLRDVTLSDLKDHQSVLSPEVFRRCRHVISEDARTLEAAEALAAGDAAEVGKLMSASHQSLKDDYEVSCRELDFLVESALAQPGVLGSRMTGGGFGGCTVNLVDRRKIDSFRESITREYQAQIQIRPDIFAVVPSDGAGEISN
jgi:galactokinase